MPRKEPRPETRQAAREAVDPNRAEEVLNQADENLQPDARAAEALREAAAEEAAEIAEEAADLARRRASETIEADDVAQANQRHQEREERAP
jgi:histone H3/H4